MKSHRTLADTNPTARTGPRALRVGIAGLAVLLLASCGYDRIQHLEERAEAARAAIEVQLQRRADVVPNLIDVVEGYAAVPDHAIERIAEARADLVAAILDSDLTGMESANDRLSAALDEVLERAGEDADVLADPGFALLRDQLEENRAQVAEAAREYNQAVEQYNSYIGDFPQAMTAKVVGARQRGFFTLKGVPPRIHPLGE